jgi:hypothetical protein
MSMTNFTESDHPRVSDGTFTDKPQSAPTVTLEHIPRASAADIQAFLDDEFAHIAAHTTLWGGDAPEPTWGSAASSLTHTTDDEITEILAADTDVQTFRAAFALRAAREGADTELPVIALRESDDMLLDSSDEQKPASKYEGERLTEYDHGHFTRADYAEVGESGISYGIQINPEYLGEIVAGTRQEGESEDDYFQRMVEAEPEYQTAISEFFAEEYGADFQDGEGTMDVVEFFVEYEDGGAEKSTIEYMGDRCEHETKLLAALNEWSYGTSMQSKFAKKLGYRYELTKNADRQFGDGHWVKDDE